MAQMRRENVRVTGKQPGKESNRVTSYLDRGLTDEQKAQKHEDTVKSLEVWMKQREARKAKRYAGFRARHML